ncbi:mitochondrial protein C2orf69 homolog isoform X2 [Macrosteles quadrilineatus]|uniref:mitochondrial protein C2orf69 homolog isoform X2 n=1 Tax=Macrosteles quadrilineatus TaxID=74068 RepID=UPI0023E12DE9|nr:mitochondrial protein C2orf69 homolog isoform X2 [Macrosteles quadrilineatus]
MRFSSTLACCIKRLFTTGNTAQKEAQGRMMGCPTLPCPLRVQEVKGYEGRTNDVIYCTPKNMELPHSAVVYFGGDVQDYPEVMESHRDNKNYLKWNLENTALILQTSFPESHIVIVKPSRMEFKTFACYDNFVPSNSCGVPEHTPDHSALLHLERLLQNLSSQVKDIAKTEAKEDTEDIQFPSLDKVEIQLVGFSKGCVVLNQFLYEFHYSKTLTPDDDSKCQVVPHITDMYWLDGGHAGGRNTWITSRNLLETLTRLGIRSHIHVTPYQINDDRRPWIRKEEKMFSDLLHKMGAAVERTVHFENQVPSLETHFTLITEFKKS